MVEGRGPWILGWYTSTAGDHPHEQEGSHQPPSTPGLARWEAVLAYTAQGGDAAPLPRRLAAVHGRLRSSPHTIPFVLPLPMLGDPRAWLLAKLQGGPRPQRVGDGEGLKAGDCSAHRNPLPL